MFYKYFFEVTSHKNYEEITTCGSILARNNSEAIDLCLSIADKREAVLTLIYKPPMNKMEFVYKDTSFSTKIESIKSEHVSTSNKRNS